MTCKRHAGILTSIITFTISPIYAAIIAPSPYMLRATLNLQAGHGFQDDFDLLVPLLGNYKQMIFANGTIAYANLYSGGDIGLGYRQLVFNDQMIVGAYGFVGRFETNHDSLFSQATIGAEMLGNVWDGRVNAYLPFGKKQNQLSESAPTDLYFQGHKLRGTQFFTNEIIGTGVDAEVGVRIPWVGRGDSTLRAYVGYYHYGFYNDVSSINGGRIRAEYRYNNYLTLTGSGSYDRILGNELVFGIRLSANAPQIVNPTTVEYRMPEYITRRKIISTRNRSQGGFVSPENFYFVNNAASPGGDGTFESPYTTVPPAENDATNDGNRFTNYVYIYLGNGSSYDLGASGFAANLNHTNAYLLGGRLNIGRNQIFIGSGTDLIYRGVNVLPASGTPTLIGGLNVSSKNLLTGFNLDGAGTGLNAGITGDNVRDVEIENVNISNYIGGNGTFGADGQDGTDGVDGGAGPTNGTAGSAGQDGQTAYGIHLTNASNIIVRNVTITNLTGGNGGIGGDGGDGGNGGTNNTVNGANGADGGAGGSGGDAIGISIENSSHVFLSNITIRNLTGGIGLLAGVGGDGGSAAPAPNPTNAGGQAGNGGNGGDAGDAIGIQLLSTSNTTIDTVTISTLTGGANGGDGNDGGDGGDAGGDVGPAEDGGDGGDGGNGGNGGDAIGIQLNGNSASITNVTVDTLLPSTGSVFFGLGGTGGAGAGGGSPGTNGTDGSSGANGIAADITP